ncbi:sensor histidine kinase [Actinomadura parmotrematis]|uniref:histidine kinase n=1 Tax=Actinomadura parmotrematis TaxID=2864039 RepID=A0ABS7FRU5_9ACTN|nr:histidine kinase [Actinomadura parmotrematis]MBW8483125.1 sensor histidine kinase [Actinomadura parmotrematis]
MGGVIGAAGGVAGALRRPGYLAGAWPWRSAWYLVSGTGPALVAAPFAMAALAGRPWFLAALAAGPFAAVPVGRWERRRLRAVDPRPVRDGHAGGPRLREAATWRELAWLGLLVTAVPAVAAALAGAALMLGVFLVSPLLAGEGPVAVGFATVGSVGGALVYAGAALALLPVLGYAAGGAALAEAWAARRLLGTGPRDELVEVTRSRARLVDAFEAERRRIERDLHDGAQQRLVGLTLQIALARLEVPDGGPAAAGLDAAHRQAKELMAELRELIHGIHPRVLTDRGLAAALGELADRSAAPVAVDVRLAGRLAPEVESTAYFVAAEALANAAKHAGARHVAVRAHRSGGLLVLEVADDGAGGAAAADGGGLAGLADRAAAVGGRMLLSSPPGGPTVVRAELPCSPSA